VNVVTIASLQALAREMPLVAAQAVSSALPAIRVRAVSGVKKHFVRQEGPDGVPWPAMKSPRPDGGNKLLRDKGLLFGSVAGRVTDRGIEVFASHPAANVHQFGATITAKRGKYLAIPVTKEAKRIGSPRLNKFPRPLFVMHARNGLGLYLAERLQDGTLVVHYILRRSVTVPARPFIGFSAETLEAFEKIIASRAERILIRLYDPNLRVDDEPTP
jgi:phage gpG-like protein